MEVGASSRLPVDGGDVLQPVDSDANKIDTKGLIMLSLLRLCSAWGERSINFAVYLFLVRIFPNTLLPASVYGFCVTGSGILFSGSVGGVIDKYNRLLVIRCATVGQKFSMGIIYAVLMAFFLTPLGRGSPDLVGPPLAAFVGVVVSGAILKVSTVCSTICIERDWASTIGSDSSQRLTKLNTWLRRIDLLCDLLSPLFVSALSAGVSYSFTASFLVCMTGASFFLEMYLTGATYHRFPELWSDRTSEARNDAAPIVAPADARTTSWHHRLLNFINPRDIICDFEEFRKLPVFYTSLSIASIYLTVLSFDGTMLTFLKDAHHYTDPFIAGQRAVCTVAGLTGTLLFPIISSKLGLVRTGSWSIWFEFVCLIPVVVALYVGAPIGATHTPTWNAFLLFGGMAFSRIGLWIFDLTQLQILQESLESHPRKNRLTSFQYILQNIFDMTKYALTMGLARPSEFRWAGLVSVIAVFVGGLLYTFMYAWRVRGHIAPHWRWLAKFKILRTFPKVNRNTVWISSN